MHEVGVAKEVLALCLEKAQGKQISHIKVKLGNDGHTTAESFKLAFNMVARGTVAQSARLQIIKGVDLESSVIDLEVEV